MRAILIDLDDDVHEQYVQMKRRLRAKKHKETIRHWFAQRVRETNKRLQGQEKK